MRGAAAVLCRYLEVRLFTCCGYPTVAHFLVIAPKHLGRVRDASAATALAALACLAYSCAARAPSRLDGTTPDQVYFAPLPIRMAA